MPEMTPDELAWKAIEGHHQPAMELYQSSWGELHARIAKAITEAVEAEREGCAKVADANPMKPVGRAIADAIRARTGDGT